MEKMGAELAYLTRLTRIGNSLFLVNSSEFKTKSGAGIEDDQGSKPNG